MGKVKTTSGQVLSCYGRFSMPEKVIYSVDYHNLFAVSPSAWRILTQQCIQFTTQDSFLFWIYPRKIVNSIKILYWMLNKVSVDDK